MMLSEVQFKELLNLVRSQQTTTATGTGGPPGLGMHRRRIDVKNVKVDKFTGMVEEWDDFAFSFKRAVRAQDVEAYRAMVEVELANEDKLKEYEDDID